DAARRKVVLFGGYCCNTVYYDDTWVWDGTSWSQEQPPMSPGPRTRASMAYDAARREVVLFGGFWDDQLNDTWVWDGSTWTLRSPPTSPSPREFATMAYDAARRKVVLFGGNDDNGGFRDTW